MGDRVTPHDPRALEVLGLARLASFIHHNPVEGSSIVIRKNEDAAHAALDALAAAGLRVVAWEPLWDALHAVCLEAEHRRFGMPGYNPTLDHLWDVCRPALDQLEGRAPVAGADEKEAPK